MNRTLLQTFEWHTPSSGDHYKHLISQLPKFSELGITSIWLPPGCKANNPKGNGYDIYDLWDLGEFEQKGSKATKWGGREDLDELIRVARECGVDVIWDAVINHKQAGDRVEDGVWAVEVDPEDRRYEICPPKQIQAWLQYDFPGRQSDSGLKYSQMKWRAEHFNGTDWDQSRHKNALYKLIDDPSTQPVFNAPQRPSLKPLAPPRSRLATLRRRFNSHSAKQHAATNAPAQRPGKGWATDVDLEHGNNDYLMFSNIDYTHAEAREDVLNWGEWMVNEVGVQGFRLDAVQHFSFQFTKDWIQHVNAAHKSKSGKDIFVVGEVWSGDLSRVTKWLDAVQQPSSGPQVYAYDAPLLYNFSRISEDVRTKSKNTDLRTILRSSLLQQRPEAAVTLVTNHDTQPGQVCYTPMDPILKTLFYAFILLRKDGLPCVFWGDLFGTHGPHAEQPACQVSEGNDEGGRRKSLLPDLIKCRKLFAHGGQKDYWDSPTCIGWTRAGEGYQPGCAVVLNVAARTVMKKMQIGSPGQYWTEILGTNKEKVKIRLAGSGYFPCKGLSVSVFVRADNASISSFPSDFHIRTV